MNLRTRRAGQAALAPDDNSPRALPLLCICARIALCVSGVDTRHGRDTPSTTLNLTKKSVILCGFFGAWRRQIGSAPAPQWVVVSPNCKSFVTP
jgi:hypothetical protein